MTEPDPLGMLKVYFNIYRSLHCVIEDVQDTNDFARRLVSTISKPRNIFRLDGEYLKEAEGKLIVELLIKGENVIVIFTGQNDRAGHYVDRWMDYTDNPGHTYSELEVGAKLRPDPSLIRWVPSHKRQDLKAEQHIPGFLLILHFDPGNSRLAKNNRFSVNEQFVEAILSLDPVDEEILTIGTKRLYTSLTMKDLCLLHLRDPETTPHLTVNEVIRKPAEQITWTDIQTLLKSAFTDEAYDTLLKDGTLNPEHLGFIREAQDLIAKEHEAINFRGLEVGAYPSIYHVLWFWPRQPDRLYRGQFDAHWPLVASLFRSGKTGAVTIQDLLDRTMLTQQFIDEIRSRQQELFGQELEDNELLAIAQHYGFPTPLLDYTHAFEVAAFFATLNAAQQSEVDTLPIGVIYCITITEYGNLTTDIAAPFNIPLLDLLGIRAGTVKVIEPDIADEDNRIKRQQGVFIADYNPRDFQGVSIDTIFFEQKRGEIFEDPRIGVTRSELLPPDSRLQILADQIKQNYKPSSMHALVTLGNTRLTEYGVIGSVGSHLFAQLREAKQFFKMLYENILENIGSEAVLAVEEILQTYFQSIAGEARVGRGAPDSASGPSSKPIADATAALALWCSVDEHRLWHYVAPLLMGGPADWHSTDPFPEPSFQPANPTQAIAWSCLLFMCAWEHLRHVDGNRARYLLQRAIYNV